MYYVGGKYLNKHGGLSIMLYIVDFWLRIASVLCQAEKFYLCPSRWSLWYSYLLKRNSAMLAENSSCVLKFVDSVVSQDIFKFQLLGEIHRQLG